jgi:hypothetical protein
MQGFQTTCSQSANEHTRYARVMPAQYDLLQCIALFTLKISFDLPERRKFAGERPGSEDQNRQVDSEVLTVPE